MHARWVGVLVTSTLAVGTAAAGPRGKDKPLPGFSGLVYRDVALPSACVKHLRVVRQIRKGDDAALVALLTTPMVTGLDFPPDDERRRTASMHRFEAWMHRLTDQGQKVSNRQVAVARDLSHSPVQRVEALARLVEAQAQIATLFQAIDIPASVRSVPDAVDAFCDAMAEKATLLEGEVTQARQYCQKLILDGNVGEGWWTEVCAPPALPAPPAP